MPTTLAVRFILGRYHATPWDGGANTSEAEWPPSPWRILRALIATRYARWPELPDETLDRVLAQLGNPSAYRTPATRPGTTRHYLPDGKHRKSETGNTDLVIDTFLAVDPGSDDHGESGDAANVAELLIQWDASLSANDRTALAKLAELVPYLGRSESVCACRLLDADPEPDLSWWRLGEAGDGVQQIDLLAVDGQVDRLLLEVSTTDTRKARRLLPKGSRKLVYGTHITADLPVTPAPNSAPITCMQFDLWSRVPARASHAVLVADAMHGVVTRVASDFPEEADRILGTGEASNHGHVHLFPLPAIVRETQPAHLPVARVVLWIRSGLSEEIAAALQARAHSLTTGADLGMPDQRVLSGPSGDDEYVIPELVGRATTWVSAMPYLPVRHRKRNVDLEAHLRVDLGKECSYRGIAEPAEVRVLDSDEFRRRIIGYRRYRRVERLRDQRSGYFVRMRFEQPVPGPIALGQLSHFGFGFFLPSVES